jgi:endonuclease YncB( thermonuclease family)
MADQEDVKDQVQESPEEKDNKEEKKFQQGIEKLTALLNGDTSARKKPKVKNDRVGELVAKINEERSKKLEEEFVKEGMEVLDNWAQFDIACAEEKKKFENAIANKKKEFLAKMNNLFGKLESIDKINGQYKAALAKVIPVAPNNNNA